MTSRHLPSTAATPCRSTPMTPTYHNNHSAYSCICFSTLPHSPHPSLKIIRVHTYTYTHQEKRNKCGNRCPTSDCSCPLLHVRLKRGREIQQAVIRYCSPLLCQHLPTTHIYFRLIFFQTVNVKLEVCNQKGLYHTCYSHFTFVFITLLFRQS